MQQFASQDWRDGRIREWLLPLLRFAITAMARIKRLHWPWRTKSMRWGSGGGRQRRVSFAVPAVKCAKRSSRAMIQREQPFSRNTSHASRILDCAERFRPRSGSTENRARRPARTKANILGQACELAARRRRYRNLINIESRRETLMQAPTWLPDADQRCTLIQAIS